MNRIFRNTLAFLVLITSLLTACSTTSVEKITPAIEVQAKFRIGGMAGWKSFEIRGDTLSYKYSRGDKIFKQETQKLSYEDIKQFEEKLISTRASNWSGHYNNKPGLADGTFWSFEYKSESLAMKSSGQNTFPNNFNELIRYISENLLKDKPFG